MYYDIDEDETTILLITNLSKSILDDIINVINDNEFIDVFQRLDPNGKYYFDYTQDFHMHFVETTLDDWGWCIQFYENDFDTMDKIISIRFKIIDILNENNYSIK